MTQIFTQIVGQTTTNRRKRTELIEQLQPIEQLINKLVFELDSIGFGNRLGHYETLQELEGDIESELCCHHDGDAFEESLRPALLKAVMDVFAKQKGDLSEDGNPRSNELKAALLKVYFDSILQRFQ